MRHLVLAVLLLLITALAMLLGQGCMKGCGCPMSPQSNFAYLQKIQDGVIFSEGFENDNFVTAEGWTVLQGVPANSSSQYQSGIKSWDNSANSQSLPVASKNLNSKSGFVVIWFYDDVSHTTEQGPYFKIKLSNGNFASIGVRNSVSTSFYCYSTPGPSVDAPDTASSIARSTGWHQFYFIDGRDFGIDGVGFNLGFSGQASTVYVCANTVGGTGNSFGFFDQLGCFINVISVDQSFGGILTQGCMAVDVPSTYLGQVNFYFSGDNLFYKNWVVSPFTGQVGIPLSPDRFRNSINYPISAYLEVSQPNSRTKLLLRSNILNINPGDIYNLVEFTPGQKFKPYNPQLAALSDINQSTSGVTETIFNAFKNKYVFGIPILEGMDYKKQYDEWYNYAVQGFPFSAQAEDNNIGFGVIDSNPALGSSVIQIKPNLSTHPTDAFTVGRKYVLFNASNTRRQTMTLLAKNDPCLTMTENFEYPFANLDYIADITFHPFLELGNNPYGLSAQDERYVRFKMQQTAQDYNGG